MRTRKKDWFNTRDHKIMFSFQVCYDGIWATPMEDGRPCIYFFERERDAKRGEYRRMK